MGEQAGLTGLSGPFPSCPYSEPVVSNDKAWEAVARRLGQSKVVFHGISGATKDTWFSPPP